MRPTYFLVPLALAYQAAPAFAAPARSILHARGGLGSVVVDGAEDAAKAVEKTSLGSTIKGALADGLGTLLGGAAASSLLGDDSDSSSSKRSLGSVVVDGAEDAAKAVEKTSIGSTIKGALADGLGTLLGGGVASEILGGSNSSAKRELLEYIHARATEELAARSLGSVVVDGAEDAAKAVEKTSIGSTIKGAVADGLGTLFGGAAASAVLGSDDDSNSSSKREILEYIHARATEELVARSLGSVVVDGAEDAAKAVEKTSIGSTIKGAVADGLGTLLGGAAASSLLGDDSDNSSSKRSLGSVVVDGAEDAAKAVEKTSIGSTIEGAVADGLGTLFGGAAASAVLGGDDSSSDGSS